MDDGKDKDCQHGAAGRWISAYPLMLAHTMADVMRLGGTQPSALLLHDYHAGADSAAGVHAVCSVSTNSASVGLCVCCRQFHLNKMIKVAGVVTRRTGVFPQLQMVKFDCQKCGHLLGPYYQNTETEIRVNSCPQCQGKHCFTVQATPH